MVKVVNLVKYWFHPIIKVRISEVVFDFRCFICKDCLLKTYKGPNKQETKWVESALHFEVLEMVITVSIESRSRSWLAVCNCLVDWQGLPLWGDPNVRTLSDGGSANITGVAFATIPSNPTLITQINVSFRKHRNELVGIDVRFCKTPITTVIISRSAPILYFVYIKRITP